MAGHTLPALMRRIDRKLMIGRGMHFTADDLKTLVASGGYAALAAALTKETESKCREQLQSEAARPVQIPPLPMPARKRSMSGAH
jgi:hypothetical protein